MLLHINQMIRINYIASIWHDIRYIYKKLNIYRKCSAFILNKLLWRYEAYHTAIYDLRIQKIKTFSWINHFYCSYGVSKLYTLLKCRVPCRVYEYLTKYIHLTLNKYIKDLKMFGVNEKDNLLAFLNICHWPLNNYTK